MKDSKFIKLILEAKQVIKDGEVFSGDLDELAKGFEYGNKDTVNLLYIGGHDGLYG